MYTLTEYGRMIGDRARMDPYALALKSIINPDSVVLDIGAGTGIHTLLACKFGARLVFAVEPSEAIILAQVLAQENGFSDRIHFIQDLSTNVSLPERADVVVSDFRGVLPLFGNHIPSVIDARHRHLKAGGSLIPKRDTLWICLVTTPYIYRSIVKPWDFPYGLSTKAAKDEALNNWSDSDTDTIRKSNLLAEPQRWCVLDYGTITDPNVSTSGITFKVTKSGTAHGWLIWFDAELTGEIGFSNGPDSEDITEVYGRAFFPLYEPVTVGTGDDVFLDIRAELAVGEYQWSWHTRAVSGNKQTNLIAEHYQSTSFSDAYKHGRIEGPS